MKKESLNNTKEKMISKCKKIGNVMEFIFWVITIGLGLSITLGLIGGIITACSGATSTEVLNEATVFVRDLYGNKIDFSEKNATRESIIYIISNILSIIVLYYLTKMFKTSAKDETPFSESNIKSMRKITICACLVFLVTSVSQIYSFGFVYVLAIIGLEHIFRYGYKLQLESDETL